MDTAARSFASRSTDGLRDAQRDLVFPFEALDPLDATTKRAIEEAALRANDRYLHEFIEDFSFCPFAREGRKAGTTERHVFIADSLDPLPLFELMRDIAARPKILVAQVIMPLIEVSPRDWRTFCHGLTGAANAFIGEPESMAVAPLHPDLPYTTTNPSTLLTLFRRAPDPTIQWVRLDGLAAIYKGRGGETVVLSPAQICEMLIAPPRRQPNLYDRIAETNMAMARRLGFEKVEAMLRGYSDDAAAEYRRILLEAP